jgi:hypothetical protein
MLRRHSGALEAAGLTFTRSSPVGTRLLRIRTRRGRSRSQPRDSSPTPQEFLGIWGTAFTEYEVKSQARDCKLAKITVRQCPIHPRGRPPILPAESTRSDWRGINPPAGVQGLDLPRHPALSLILRSTIILRAAENTRRALPIVGAVGHPTCMFLFPTPMPPYEASTSRPSLNLPEVFSQRLR